MLCLKNRYSVAAFVFVSFAIFLVFAGCIETSLPGDDVGNERIFSDRNYPALHTAETDTSAAAESTAPVEVPLPPEEEDSYEEVRGSGPGGTAGANPYDPLNENVGSIEASVAPEDMKELVVSSLSMEETALLENITLEAERDRLDIGGVEIAEGWVTVNFVRLGIYPHYGDENSTEFSIYEPAGNISVDFFNGSGDGAQYLGGFEEPFIKFAEDMGSVSRFLDLAAEPDRVVVSVGSEKMVDRKISPSYVGIEEGISIPNVFRATDTTLALRIRDENPAAGNTPHFWRIVIYRVGDDGIREWYSDTYISEFDFDERNWTFSPAYSIANLSRGFVEIRNTSGELIAEKDFDSKIDRMQER